MSMGLGNVKEKAADRKGGQFNHTHHLSNRHVFCVQIANFSQTPLIKKKKKTTLRAIDSVRIKGVSVLSRLN